LNKELIANLCDELEGIQNKCDELQAIIHSYEDEDKAASTRTGEPDLTNDEMITELQDALAAKDEVIDAGKQRQDELRQQVTTIT